MSLIVGTCIGSGAYGSVYNALWQGRKAAIKIFLVSQDEIQQEAALDQEIHVLKQLKHRNIIQFYGTDYHEGNLFLVMDYAEGGSLSDAISDGRLVDWSDKERIAQEIVRGLDYVHYMGFLHRDLKSMNVLLTRNMEAKLCDFGMATVKICSVSKSTAPRKGSFRWMAPELFAPKPEYSTKSDMYALGMVMWEIAANCTEPFRDRHDASAVMDCVLNGEQEVLPSDTPEAYSNWVKRCWDKDPGKRPEAKDMVTVDEEPDGMDKPSGDESKVGTYGSRSENATLIAPNGNPRKGGPIGGPDDDINNLEARAQGGDIKAQVALALKYEYGTGTQQNYSEAHKWYFRAAALGSQEARHKLLSFNYDGRITLQSREAVVHWFETTAEQGDVDVQSALGWMYQNGQGVNKDYNKALYWYSKSAQHGNAEAQNSLGWMYQHGQGVKKSYQEAISWYTKAAKQGHAAAQNSLGGIYRNGMGVVPNLNEAIQWYHKSAEQGYAEAQYNLGGMYRLGIGVETDYKKAVELYRASADQGLSDSQWSLGRMYEVGEGVPQDILQTMEWYRKAAEQGHDHAIMRLNKLGLS
ncbi:hypothetical protein BGW41_005044 [Actinomortierella wolfii]|nr:hypothetical protein BGW41_005044 [Actinomortierella wolfii]